jgi:DNA-binding IclR family transcriptional regulator
VSVGQAEHRGDHRRRPDELETAFGKILAVLHAFRADEDAVSLSELTHRTGLAKSTVHRIAADLVGGRFLHRVPGGYILGRHLFELGMRARQTRRLCEIATPLMHDLHRLTRETVHLGITDGVDVMYLQKISDPRTSTEPTYVGGRMPLYCTALGKALLAHGGQGLFDAVLTTGLDRRTSRTLATPERLHAEIARVAREDLAYEHEESIPGIACVASPVRAAGVVIAAVSVSAPVMRFRSSRYLDAVRTTANEISVLVTDSA